MLQIIKRECVETNPNYDPDRRWNGGGYSQPDTTLTFSDGVTFTISDTSCGDFGSRIDVKVEKSGEVVARASYGSMYKFDEWFSSIDYGVYGDHLDLIWETEHYDIYTAKQYEMWNDKTDYCDEDE